MSSSSLITKVFGGRSCEQNCLILHFNIHLIISHWSWPKVKVKVMPCSQLHYVKVISRLNHWNVPFRHFGVFLSSITQMVSLKGFLVSSVTSRLKTYHALNYLLLPFTKLYVGKGFRNWWLLWSNFLNQILKTGIWNIKYHFKYVLNPYRAGQLFSTLR